MSEPQFDAATLKIALPKGSLNQAGRFVTRDLLVDAGLEVSGYEPGQEAFRPGFPGVPWLQAFTDRPQNMALKLCDGTYDIGILGHDWVAQFAPLTDSLVELVDLKGATTSLLFAISAAENVASVGELIRKKAAAGEKLVCYTELVGSAFKALTEQPEYKAAYGSRKPVIFVEGHGKVGDNEAVEIVRSHGQTELGIIEGRLVLDIMQTGATLARAGGVVLETASTSHVSLYGGAHVLGDDSKCLQARQIAMQLDGAIIARDYDYVQFNVPASAYEAVRTYLDQERLYVDEPTVIQGDKWHQVGIYAAKLGWLTLSSALAALGASAILRYEPAQVIGFQQPRPYERALESHETALTPAERRAG